MTGASICVLGSANMDLVAMAERVPDPGETVTGDRFVLAPGGKGLNQALAAARAGGTVRILGAVGDDIFGEQARSVLDADGVDTRGLLTSEEPTGTAHIRVDAHGENSIIVVPGSNATVRTLTDFHRETIACSDVLLMQLELPLKVAAEAAAWARRTGTQVILTPAPAIPLPAEVLSDTRLLVPNEHEVEQLVDAPDPAPAAQALLDRGVGAVVTTMGKRGCVYRAAGAEPVTVAAQDVPAVDTTAAGDTFAGSLGVAIAEGWPLREALEWATAAAALSVQRVGASASMPRRSEIRAMLNNAGGELPF